MGKEIVYEKFLTVINKEKFVLRITDTIKHESGTINRFYCSYAYWSCIIFKKLIKNVLFAI